MLHLKRWRAVEGFGTSDELIDSFPVGSHEALTRSLGHIRSHDGAVHGLYLPRQDLANRWRRRRYYWVYENLIKKDEQQEVLSESKKKGAVSESEMQEMIAKAKGWSVEKVVDDNYVSYLAANAHGNRFDC